MDTLQIILSHSARTNILFEPKLEGLMKYFTLGLILLIGFAPLSLTSNVWAKAPVTKKPQTSAYTSIWSAYRDLLMVWKDYRGGQLQKSVGEKWQVIVEMEVLASGKMENVRISKKTGHAVLDQILYQGMLIFVNQGLLASIYKDGGLRGGRLELAFENDQFEFSIVGTAESPKHARTQLYNLMSAMLLTAKYSMAEPFLKYVIGKMKIQPQGSEVKITSRFQVSEVEGMLDQAYRRSFGVGVNE